METNTLFTQKFENFQKAINRQEAAWVPNAVNDCGGGMFWSGKTVFDVAGNHLEYAKTITSYLDEMWADVCLLAAITTSPRRDSAFPTAENQIAKDGTITHLQTPHMKAEEYDQLIADPKAFIANVLLPRKYPYLFESRDAAKAALKVFAEEQGLIGEIGNIVFEKVCEFAAREKLWQLGIDYIEVNLSGVQSVDISIVATLTNIMRKYGVHPGFFNLEITETASIDGGDMLTYNMEQFRRLGCHFSMDDFGTGYSNLAQMAKVHFELIKLDKSLIWPCFDEDEEAAAEPRIILDSCIDMILRLGMNIVAEGVETAEQAELLISRGVEYLQGYYFCRPVMEADFVAAVKNKLAEINAQN